MTATPPPGPGWYASPWQGEQDRLRYWDGYRWTDRPSLAAPTPQGANGGSKTGLFVGIGVVLALAVVMAVIAVIAVVTSGKSFNDRQADRLAVKDGPPTAADYEDYEHAFGLLVAACAVDSVRTVAADVDRVAAAEIRAGIPANRITAMAEIEQASSEGTPCPEAASILVSAAQFAAGRH